METEKRAPREKYDPPKVERIKLTADEVASTGCKSLMIGLHVCRNGSIIRNYQQGS